MTYLPGETVSVTVIGKVGRIIEGDDVNRAEGDWPEIRVDVESEVGGITLAIPLGWAAVSISRVMPAAGLPKPGELWTNRNGEQLFVTKDRYGNPQFVTTTDLPHSIADMNNRSGPLTPIYRLPEPERVPDWTWDDEDNPRTATDPSGTVWDLTAQYQDGEGHTWHWAGGFGRDGVDGPMRPLMARDDWSRDNVQITDVPAPLTLISVDEPGAGEG